jgi:hypothetical protein
MAGEEHRLALRASHVEAAEDEEDPPSPETAGPGDPDLALPAGRRADRDGLRRAQGLSPAPGAPKYPWKYWTSRATW